jgi:hypothetical protein
LAVRLTPSLTLPRPPESRAADAGRLDPSPARPGATDQIALWGLVRQSGSRILQETLPWITRDRRAREALSEAITQRMLADGMQNLLKRLRNEGPFTRDILEAAVGARLRDISRPGRVRHGGELGKPGGTVMNAAEFRRSVDEALATGIARTRYLDGPDGPEMVRRLQAAVEFSGAAERAFLRVLDEWSVGLGSASLGLGAGAGIGATLTHLLHHLRGND